MNFTNEFLRYSCQIALPDFSETGQKKLRDAKVLIVGAGGLGCPAAQYLAAIGVGTIAIADFDTVSISNLHRQILYTPAEVGMKKAVIACKKLQEQNPSIRLIPYDIRINSDNVMEIVEQFDIVSDGTDNFETRFLLNDACVLLNKPIVYGAIYQYEGQVAVWNVANDDGSYSPNYRDVFPEVDASQIPNCAEGGVIPTLAGIIGCMQANEVIKYLTNTGELLSGKILMLDAQTMQSRILKIGERTKAQIKEIQQTEYVPTITIECLQQNMDDYALIDVRNTDERNIFHIGGKHVPLSALYDNSFLFETNKPIVFYCASGKRSAEAVKMIKKETPGADVYSLEGGIKAWLETL